MPYVNLTTGYSDIPGSLLLKRFQLHEQEQLLNIRTRASYDRGKRHGIFHALGRNYAVEDNTGRLELFRTRDKVQEHLVGRGWANFTTNLIDTKTTGHERKNVPGIHRRVQELVPPKERLVERALVAIPARPARPARGRQPARPARPERPARPAVYANIEPPAALQPIRIYGVEPRTD